MRSGIVSNRAELVFVRDLPLAVLAICEAKRAGLPCVVDMAENHPEMWLQVCRNDRWKFPSLVLKNPALARKLEARVARSADFIFVVVEEMRDHLLRIGADPERIRVVSNTPDLEAFRGFEEPPAEPADDQPGPASGARGPGRGEERRRLAPQAPGPPRRQAPFLGVQEGELILKRPLAERAPAAAGALRASDGRCQR